MEYRSEPESSSIIWHGLTPTVYLTIFKDSDRLR